MGCQQNQRGLIVLTKFKVHVVGVSFNDSYPDNLLSMKQQLDAGAVRVELRREPDNQFDEHAVLVCCGNKPIGHVPAGLAARLSPMLADGEQFSCFLDEILVSSEAPERPGAVITCERVGLHV